MPKKIHLPDGRIVNFPDNMSMDDIGAAISSMNLGQEANDGPGWGTALAAGGALAGGLALRNTKLMKTGATKAFDLVQGLRHLGALSGAAVPKSVVGNVGAPFVAAAERKSLEPIRQFFSKQTAKDWMREIRDPEVGIAQQEPGSFRMWNPFGRLMSAGDVATRKALVRGGTSDAEAAKYTLQTPLGELGLHGPMLEALESKAGRAAVLYRRTPLNSVVHGVTSSIAHPGLAAGAVGAGALQGSAGGEVSDPLAVALTAPLAGVYSVPYLLGAGAGKLMSTGRMSDAKQMTRGISPVPEDVGAALYPTEMLRPLDKPAVISFIERLQKLRATGKSY